METNSIDLNGCLSRNRNCMDIDIEHEEVKGGFLEVRIKFKKRGEEEEPKIALTVRNTTGATESRCS